MQAITSTARNTTAVMACGAVFAQQELEAVWLSQRFQDALRGARTRFGHALCLCRREPLKLQIRERDAHCHLAVWPHDGPSHDSECIYFRDDVAAPASREGAQPADPGDGVNVPAKRSSYRLDGKPCSSSRSTTVRSLGTLLWEQASLCRWHPNWTRDWGRTRYQLMLAAAELTLDGVPGEKFVFVPRPYRESQQQALNSDWEEFARALNIQRGSTRMLIAPMRRIAAGSGPAAAIVHLRHLRSPIGLSTACYDYVARDCRNVLRNDRLQAQPAAEWITNAPEVIGFFVVEGNARGGVWAKAAWLMPVHPRLYIPAANHDTVLLIDRLVEQRYAFQRLLSDAPPSKREAADWLVRHVVGPDGKPVARAALEILDRGCSASFLEARSAIASRMQREGIPTWTWIPEGKRAERQVPPLPPHDFTSPAVAASTVAQLQRHPYADYRLGPSTKFSTAERKAS